MGQVLQVVYTLAVVIGYAVALWNWVLIVRGQDRYPASAIGAFVLGAGSAFLYQWLLAGLAALLILLLALHRWLTISPIRKP